MFLAGKRRSSLALLFVSAFLSGLPLAHAAVKLSPQTVVDLALSKGRRAKAAELAAQRSYLGLEKAEAEFDVLFRFNPSYEYSEAQDLTGRANPIDKTLNLTTSLQKKFSSGTTFTLQYDSIRQSSVLSSFSTASRLPQAALDAATLTMRQSLWRNAFGYADRLAVEIAETTVSNAKEVREESLEEILLNAMTLFWNAYVAERQLKENMAAREKYEALVGNIRRKAGFNLSTPGELPRLEAELEGADQRVKSSSAAYLSAVDSLLTAIQLETKETVEFEVPANLPPVPQLKEKDVESLRLLRVAKANVENANRNISFVKNSGRPKLDLVAKAKSTGVDETPGASVAEMTATTHPTYYVGIEFETPLGSDYARAAVADAEVQTAIAENDLKIQRESVRDQLRSLERQVAAQFAVAKSASETVELRQRVVREVEAAYRQGRQPMVELIRAYNDLFGAQLERAKAVGQYHIALNQLAAARDELVANVN